MCVSRRFACSNLFCYPGRLLDALYELFTPTPDQSAGMATDKSSSPHPRECFSKKRILIAEDNQINVKVAIGVLARMNVTNITVARDGLELLEKVQEQDGPSYWDVILMDLHMPRMGGIEATAEMRKLYPDHNTPVVAVTADAFEDSREKCKSVGFSGLLAKPFRVEELQAVLSSSDHDS